MLISNHPEIEANKTTERLKEHRESKRNSVTSISSLCPLWFKNIANVFGNSICKGGTL